MIDPKITEELNDLRKIVGEYADAAACLSRTINEVEDTIQEEKNPLNEYVYSYVLNQARLRECIRDHYDFSKLDRDEANCWYCLLSVLKPKEEES